MKLLSINKKRREGRRKKREDESEGEKVRVGEKERTTLSLNKQVC